LSGHARWLAGAPDGRPAALRYADLRQTDLRQRPLARVDLRDADLEGADLREIDLRQARLDNAEVREADLSGARLQRASLRHAVLKGTRLERAELGWADLKGSDLHAANLWGASLRFACLESASLGGARLDGCRLSGANLRRVYLVGATLAGVTAWWADWTDAEPIGIGHDHASGRARRWPTALAEADAFLAELLADGPVAATEALRRAAQAGIARRTLARAKQRLAVRATRVDRPGFGPGGRWVWSLPTWHEEPFSRPAGSYGPVRPRAWIEPPPGTAW
jgi:hypothetical protein